MIVPVIRKQRYITIWSRMGGWAKNAFIVQKMKKPNLYEPITKSRMFATVTFERYSEPINGKLDITILKAKNKLFKFVKRRTSAIMGTPLLLTVREGRKNSHHLIKLTSYDKRIANKSKIVITSVSFDELDNIEFLQLIEKTRPRFEKKKK